MIIPYMNLMKLRVDQLFWLNMDYSCFADVAQPTWIKSLIHEQDRL